MPTFQHDNVEIAFLDEGEGEPIVLVHGFASNKEVNWVAPGWITTTTEEVQWIAEWCHRRAIPYAVLEKQYPTATVGDPVCFVRVG